MLQISVIPQRLFVYDHSMPSQTYANKRLTQLLFCPILPSLAAHMAHPENKPQMTPAQPESLTLLAKGKLIVSDTEHQVVLEKTNGMLSLQVNRLDRPLFSAAVTPENRVHLVFAPAMVGSPLDSEAVARLGQEPRKEPEHPPITIEGFPVRGAKYDKDEKTGKRTYGLTIAHHPTEEKKRLSTMKSLQRATKRMSVIKPM
jgi:hypothetical protein